MCSNFSTARRKVFPMRKLHVVLKFSDTTSSSLKNRMPFCRSVVYPLVPQLPGSPDAGVTVPQFHVEPALVGHGSCRPCRHCPLERWRTPTRLGGFRWYRAAPVCQLRHRILRGTERWKRRQGPHGLSCAQSQGEALWELARN
jgi:hypothetical protein